MKLSLTRNQTEQKGLFGGHKGMNFSLAFKVDLDPDEKNLIARYKAGQEPIAVDLDNPQTFLTIESLTAGKSYVRKNVGDLLEAEEKIRDACGNFKMLLKVMSTFGGEEIVEF